MRDGGLTADELLNDPQLGDKCLDGTRSAAANVATIRFAVAATA